MRLLLTGASGFLGQHVLHSFLHEPESAAKVRHIHALVNSSTALDAAVREKLQKLGGTTIQVEVESVDLTDPSSVTSFLARHPRMDVCIHTAALSIPRLCEQDPDRAAKLNNPTHFFDALIQAKTFIIALSTDQVYQGDPTQAPYSETDDTKPVNTYGQTKVDMEVYLLQHYPNRSVLLRSSLILGPKAPLLPDQTHDTFFHFIASRHQQETTFFIDECRSAVFVNDVVSCLAWFVNRAGLAMDDSAATATTAYPAGVYNLGGPASCSRMDMARAVFQWLGYNDKYLVPVTRAEELSASSGNGVVVVKSPLDISMVIDKLQVATGLTMTDLATMVEATFPRTIETGP